MNNKKNFLKVDTYINNMSTIGEIDSFYPQLISKKLNIPLDLVMVELMKCVDNGKLIFKYEIRCLDDLTTIQKLDGSENIYNILGNDVECPRCGAIFSVNYANIYPIFYIDDEFRSMVKKTKH